MDKSQPAPPKKRPGKPEVRNIEKSRPAPPEEERTGKTEVRKTKPSRKNKGRADKSCKGRSKKPGKDFAMVQSRVKKQRKAARSNPERAFSSGNEGLLPRRRIRKRDEKVLQRMAREEVANLLNGHVSRVEAAVAVLEELPDVLRRAEEGIKRLEGEIRELREEDILLVGDQEPEKVPMLPNHLMDTVFPGCVGARVPPRSSSCSL